MIRICGTELEEDKPMGNAIIKLFGLILVAALFVASTAARAGVAEGRVAYKNKDFATALKEFLPPAEEGDPVALFYIALMYEKSEGLPQNFAQAMILYRRAADKGFAPAQTNLGVMYETEAGSDRSYKDAAFWYRKAAEQGDASAEFNLGLMYFIGRGSDVPHNRQTAVEWYRRAAEQGHAVAQDNLGKAYEYGLGVLADLPQAYMWYTLSAMGGDEKAKADLKAVEVKLSPDMIVQAKAMVNEWLASHNK
jgi:TPR repeat protein